VQKVGKRADLPGWEVKGGLQRGANHVEAPLEKGGRRIRLKNAEYRGVTPTCVGGRRIISSWRQGGKGLYDNE